MNTQEKIYTYTSSRRDIIYNYFQLTLLFEVLDVNKSEQTIIGTYDDI